MNIDADERQNHFLKVDLINRAEAFVEMRRRINVSAPLTDVSENLCEKSLAHQSRLFFVPVNYLLLLIGKTGPVRNSRTKLVR